MKSKRLEFWLPIKATDESPEHIPYHVSHIGSSATDRPWAVAFKLDDGYASESPLDVFFGAHQPRFKTLKAAQKSADHKNELHRRLHQHETQIKREIETKMKPTAKIETVTPEIAAEYLKLNHAKQRNMTNSHMIHLSQQMKVGQWKMNGESVIFDHEGNILDGQHRMNAVIDSGVASDFVIVRGIDPDCFPTIDRGKPRSNGNAFAIAGIPNYNVAASATSGVINYRRALSVPIKENGSVIGYGGSLNSYLRASTTDMLDEYYAHEAQYAKAIQIAISCRPKAPPSCVSTVAALSLIDGSCGEDWVSAFWEGFLTGGNLPLKSPILKLKDRLEKNTKSQAKLTQSQLITLMVKAWNLYAGEKECGVLRVDSDNAVPIK